MPTNNKIQGPKTPVWEKPTPNYAYKPYKIGALIKKIAQDKNIPFSELERRMGFSDRNIYRIFNAQTLSMKLLFAASEALEENLLLEFHPNVKPLPNPMQAELDQLKAENENLKAQLNELKPLADENKVLKGQLDILREVMKGK